MSKRKNHFLILFSLLLIGILVMGMVSCNDQTDDGSSTGDSVTESDTAGTIDETEGSSDESTATDTTEESITESKETETEEPTETSVKDQIGLNVKEQDMKDIMQNIFSDTTSRKETVMFIDKGDIKSLLFPINSIVSVTSYDGAIVYEEGKDYIVEDGRLKVTENSAINVITSAKYYNYTGSMITLDGKPIYWGESMIKQWQVSVTYTHDDVWDGYLQESQLEIYRDFVQKLVNGEDVTVFFYGDSITWGACCSFAEGDEPRQGAYAMLFTEALADLFGYTVKYINTGLTASMPCHTVPTTDYVAGDRGTITYVNTAIGGWTSADGVKNYNAFVKKQVEKYGCDLLVLAFGMNDDNISASTTASNMKRIADSLFTIKPDAAVMFISSMSPHNGTNWDHASIKAQEDQLIAMAKKLQNKGHACAVACMNSVSLSVLEHKTFNDYSGNNINHPNDWFYRVYAQTMLQTLIGYENMDRSFDADNKA